MSEWIAYYNLEPFGEAQNEYRAALVASTVANTARDTQKHRTPFEAGEFMRQSYLGEKESEQSEAENLWLKAKAIFGLFGLKKD